jgi:hypothetical protein
MRNRVVARSGSVALRVALVVVALALLVPAAALAASTPSVTIVGPNAALVTPSPSPTAAVPAVEYEYVQLYLQDNGWNADHVRFSNDGGATWSTPEPFADYTYWSLYEGGSRLTWLDGTHTVTAQFSNDDGETWGATSSATTILDQQSPVVQAFAGYWNNHHAYVLSAHDQVGFSGVLGLYYRLDAEPLVQVMSSEPVGTSIPLKASFTLAGETGTPHTIQYIAQDYAGNVSGMSKAVLASRLQSAKDFSQVVSTSAYVVIDRTPPTVKARGWDDRWHRGLVVVSFSARDANAGLDRIQYSVTGVRAKKHAAWTTGNSVVVSQPGRHKVWFRALDGAQPVGNASAPKYVIVKVL